MEDGPGGPKAALEQLRRGIETREGELRGSLCEAALEVAGEVGWRRVSVELIIVRAGVSRARFYRLFADKDECLTEAHRTAATRLIDEILGDLSEAPDPRAGLRRALGRVATLTEERPLLARGLLAEARLGGGAISVSRAEVFERLSRAVPDACRETTESRHSPPPFAAPFILAAVASAVSDATRKAAPTPISGRLDALADLACLAYRPGAVETG
jgi:AcrR family transcriptional regulator